MPLQELNHPACQLVAAVESVVPHLQNQVDPPELAGQSEDVGVSELVFVRQNAVQLLLAAV